MLSTLPETNNANPDTTNLVPGDAAFDTPPASAETWPGEWQPSRSDATVARDPLKTSFIRTFTQALYAANCHPSDTTDLFDERAESTLSIDSARSVKVGIIMALCVTSANLMEALLPSAVLFRPPRPSSRTINSQDEECLSLFPRFHGLSTKSTAGNYCPGGCSKIS